MRPATATADNPNPIDLAEAAMRLAKHRFSLAALACLRQAPDAAAMVQAALQEVDRARAMLSRAADAELERAPDRQKAVAPRRRGAPS